jgi:hypothetical protein
MSTTKLFAIAIFSLSFAICGGGAYQNTPNSTSNQSRMHHMQQQHPDRLSVDEQHVYYMLSPLYQRIFLYGLDDDQREMITVFEKRGENPYQAIDNLLRRDRKKADRSFQRDPSPSGRSTRAGQQNRYIISEKEKEQKNNTEDEVYDDQEYVIYSESSTTNTEKQTPYMEKDPSDYESKSPANCNSCAPKRKAVKQEDSSSQKQSAFVKRCKAYFAKENTKEPQQKANYQGNPNWKKYEYKETVSKKRKCKCGT